MKTTDKQGCNALVEILVKQGVKRAVLSPGSRNAPVLMAFSRCEAIESYVVVDERTAAFMAHGLVLSGVSVLGVIDGILILAGEEDRRFYLVRAGCVQFTGL